MAKRSSSIAGVELQGLKSPKRTPPPHSWAQLAQRRMSEHFSEPPIFAGQSSQSISPNLLASGIALRFLLSMIGFWPSSKLTCYLFRTTRNTRFWSHWGYYTSPSWAHTFPRLSKMCNQFSGPPLNCTSLTFMKHSVSTRLLFPKVERTDNLNLSKWQNQKKCQTYPKIHWRL